MATVTLEEMIIGIHTFPNEPGNDARIQHLKKHLEKKETQETLDKYRARESTKRNEN